MYVLHIACRPGEKDALVAELWECGTTGIVEDDRPGGGTLLRAFFEDQPPGLAERHAGKWEREEERDWVALSRAQWEPVLVGARFFLVPEWSGAPTPAGRLRLEMQPGRACGTGWHPATQLALEAMERHVGHRSTVLDVGTGSGILAVAAAMLGAAGVIACDLDRDAAAVAQERFRSSGVPAGLFVGSVRSVRSAAVDVVMANINAATLVDLTPEIARVRRPGGRAILSGFPRRQLARVEAAYGPGEVLEKDGWTALVC